MNYQRQRLNKTDKPDEIGNDLELETASMESKESNRKQLASLVSPPALPGRSLISTVVLIMAAVLVITIAISGWTGSIGNIIGTQDTSSTDKPVLEAQVAVAGISLARETVEPVNTETETPIITRTPRPTRTRAATATRIPTAVFTMIAATHIAHMTTIAERREAIETSVVLTQAPTVTPGRPLSYPSATPIMGMLPGCGNTSSDGPQATSCWRGIVDGQLVIVYAGREGRNGDRTQGILWVHTAGQQGEDIYQTPQRLGAVRITSVDGTLFTLATAGQQTPQQFVFDMDIRQWVSP